MGDFKNLNDIPQEYLNFLGLFAVVFLIGSFIQIVAFKRSRKHEDKQELKIKLENI